MIFKARGDQVTATPGVFFSTEDPMFWKFNKLLETANKFRGDTTCRSVIRVSIGIKNWDVAGLEFLVYQRKGKFWDNTSSNNNNALFFRSASRLERNGFPYGLLRFEWMNIRWN